MGKFSIPAAAQPYLAELKALIRAGVHSAPSLGESPLLKLPAVVAAAGRGAPPSVQVRAFTDILHRVIQERLQGLDRETAAILFAYDDYAGMATRDRYERVAEIQGKQKWDGFRKEPLDRHLVAVYLALVTFAEGPADNSQPSSEPQRTTRHHSAGGQYILRSREVVCNLPWQEGEAREVIDRREIEATADNIGVWRQTKAYIGRRVATQPTFALFGAGKLSVVQESRLQGIESSRAHLLEVEFPTPLSRGDRAQFAIYMRHPVNFEDVVRHDYRDGWKMTPIIQTDSFSLAVRFPQVRRPRSVW